MEAAEVELFERSVRQATERLSGEALDAALTELGWPDALAADPHTAVAVLFPAQGAVPAESSALDQVVLTGLGMAGIADAVVLPPLGSCRAAGTVDGDRIRIRGLGGAALRKADRAAVVARPDGDERVVVDVVATADLTLRPVRGIDPTFGLVEVSGDVCVVAPAEAPGHRWDAAVVLAQLALSHEILGAARTMLTLACAHALERVQFGQPISRFQAVRHRLAETLVPIEGADAVVRAARDEPTPVLAGIAKALAGRSALTAARHCQQVLAGIGFTQEHPFHRSYRRVLLLDQLFGSTHALTHDLGAELLRSREVPPLLPL
jgi:alkylation response protein AidB-like acyl-CoA dehydrogenase